MSEGHCENQIKYFQEKVFCIKHFANVSYLNAVMIQGGSLLRNQLLSPSVCQRLYPQRQKANSLGEDKRL